MNEKEMNLLVAIVNKSESSPEHAHMILDHSHMMPLKRND
jgi:hypothetical protein